MAEKKKDTVEVPELTEDEKNEAVRQEAKRRRAAARLGEKIDE